MKLLTLTALLLVACSSVSYRPITYPSPCEGNTCKVVGYEIWGEDEESITAKAEKLCKQRAHVSMSYPAKEYAVTRCESQEDPVTVVVTEE